MITPAIDIYLLPWHLSQSDAFQDILISPLQDFATLTCRAYSAHSAPLDPTDAQALVFCQVLPDLAWLSRQRARTVWAPMFDDVECHPASWWAELPKTLHVIAFSGAVASRARTAGLPTFEIQYFKDPSTVEPVSWKGERVLFYWNRRGLVGPGFLARACEALAVDRLLFRDTLDPGVDPRAGYQLPQRLGTTTVEPFPRTKSREEYWQKLAPANMVIAPRMFEGVGLVALEMLARGCLLLAYDAPTMNEYIESGRDGILLRRRSLFERIRDVAINRVTGDRFIRPVPDGQAWTEIARLEAEQTGAAARKKHDEGFRKWRQRLPALAEFVLGDASQDTTVF